MTIEMPEPQSLDLFVQSLGSEVRGWLPELAYEQDGWCLLLEKRRPTE
jgi:hypothetical protein